jgi:hypothetical protein
MRRAETARERNQGEKTTTRCSEGEIEDCDTETAGARVEETVTGRREGKKEENENGIKENNEGRERKQLGAGLTGCVAAATNS